MLFSFKWLVEAYNNNLFANGFENTFLKEEMDKVLALMKCFITACFIIDYYFILGASHSAWGSQ